MPQRPTIDVYARLSRAVNGETIQVEDQIELCTEKILARGGRVGEVFSDNSLSAWRPGVVRESWLRLMERLESGASDGVMVYDLYRFSRKVLEGERLLEAAQGGLRVWALAGEYDLTSADGRKHFRDAIVAAAAESDKISERVQRGKTRQARQGRASGGARGWAMPGLAPRGPEAVGWRGQQRLSESAERVDAEREVAREAMARLLGGEAVAAVVRDLNERGRAGERAALPVSGKPWRAEMLIRTLCRPAMAGLLQFRGEIVGGLADVEPVVDRPEWERFVAKVAARKTGRPPVARHLLSGVIRCGLCGSVLYAYARGQQETYPDGSMRREYRCPSPKSTTAPGCGRNAIDAAVAEQAVERALVARLRDPRRAELVSEKLAAVSGRRTEIVAQIEAWETEADNLADKTTEWGVARVDRSMKPILATIEQLRAQLAALGDEELFGAAVGDAVAEWEQVRADENVIRQRQIIRRVFPNLTLAERSGRGDHRAARLLWDGTPVS